MPLSVVIPVYNRTLLLKDAIESVFFQTYKDIQVIVVDDGSDTDVADFLKPYLGRVEYVRIERNRGVSYARNVGIQRAKNDYIAFLDSDDIWLPYKIENQFKLMKEEKTFVSHTDEFWLKNDKFVNQGNKHRKYGGFIFKNILDICRISPSSVLVDKRVFDVCGLFNTRLPVCEDYDLWLRLASAYKVSYVNKKLMVKRSVGQEQLSFVIPNIEYYRLKSLGSFLNREKHLSFSDRSSGVSEFSRKFDLVRNGVYLK